jgi:hypothetical protein
VATEPFLLEHVDSAHQIPFQGGDGEDYFRGRCGEARPPYLLRIGSARQSCEPRCRTCGGTSRVFAMPVAGNPAMTEGVLPSMSPTG